MRFTTAWADTVAQNLTLKVALVCLAITSIALGLTAAKLSLREPLVIERSCYSKALSPASSERTNSEIEAFVKGALSQRFDTDSLVIPGYLSQSEEGFKKQEQDSLKSRGITQTVLVKAVDIQPSQVTVQAYRILFLNDVGSPIRFPIVLTLSTGTRTAANPYGLMINRVAEVKEEPGKKDGR